MKHASIRRHLAASVTALALIGLATGCGDDDDAGRTPVGNASIGSDGPSTAPSPSGAPSSASGTVDTTAGVLAAVAAAEAVAPGGRVVKVDSDSDDVPRPLWEVVVVDKAGNGTEYRFAQADLAAIDQKPEKLDQEERVASTVDVREAIDIALGEVPGEVRSLELDENDGTVVWEVSILDRSGVEMKVDVDADSGVVVRSSRDD